MKPQRLEVLLWERVDGTITAEDRAELDVLLAEHRDGVRLARQVAGLAERLDALETVAPPEQLRARIAGALADTGQHGVRAGGSVATRLRPLRRTQPLRWLPLAAVMIVGVALGALFQTLGEVEVDESTAVGSIGLQPVADAPVATLQIAEGGGTVAVFRAGSTVRLDLHLARETTYEIVLEDPPETLRLTVFDGDAGTNSILDAREGRIAFRTYGAGARRLEVAVGPDAQRLHIEVRAEGEVAADAWLDLAGDGSQG